MIKASPLPLCIVWIILGNIASTLWAVPIKVILPNGNVAIQQGTAVFLEDIPTLTIKDGSIASLYLGEKAIISVKDGYLEVTEDKFGRWFFLYPEGWVDEDISSETRTISLKPWNELRGKVSTELMKEGYSEVIFRSSEPYLPKCTYISWQNETLIGKDGNFVIKMLPDGSGVVGLANRVQPSKLNELSWIDYPMKVVLPSEQPLALSNNGVEVHGELPEMPFELLITISSQSDPDVLSYFGLANRNKRFSIPGVPVGDYQVILRPIGVHREEFQIRQNFSIKNNVTPVDLGVLPLPVPDFDISPRVDYQPSLIEKIRGEAAKQCSRPIKKIRLGEFGFFSDRMGARITYEPEIVEKTYAIVHTCLLEIPAKTTRKYYPESNIEGYGLRFSEEDSFKPLMLKERVRVFPLKNQTLYLSLEESLDYEIVLALLKSIEAGDYKINDHFTDENGKVWYRLIDRPEKNLEADLSRIYSIRKVETNGNIKLDTKKSTYRGDSFEFRKEGDQFILLSRSSWVQ